LGEIARVKNFLIALLTGLIFCGCSITPRYHSFGYNVEWKTRGTAHEKVTPTDLPSESQKRYNHNRNEITREENRSEIAKTRSFTEEKKLQIDTIRKNDISRLAQIASDTSEKTEEQKKIDRRIKVTNRLILGDLISIPLAAATDVEQNLNGLIYIIFIAIPLLIFLLFARMSQGIKRRRLKNKTAMHSQSNRTGTFYTAEKNLHIENRNPTPDDAHDGHKSAKWGFYLSIIGLLALPILGPLYISPIAFVLSVIALVKSERKTKVHRKGAWGAFLGYLGLAFASIIISLLSYGYIDLLLLSIFTMVVLPMLVYLTVKARVKKQIIAKSLSQS
jgi:uncharacterized membrane protein